MDCADAVKFEVVRLVTERFRRTHSILDVDAACILFPEGWGLVRASDTQPVLVLRFEAASPDLLREYRAMTEAVVAEAVAQTA